METERPSTPLTGDDLRACRQAAGLSQRAVAAAMTIEPMIVDNLEGLGPNRPARRMAARYLAAVDTIAFLRNGAARAAALGGRTPGPRPIRLDGLTPAQQRVVLGLIATARAVNANQAEGEGANLEAEG